MKKPKNRYTSARGHASRSRDVTYAFEVTGHDCRPIDALLRRAKRDGVVTDYYAGPVDEDFSESQANDESFWEHEYHRRLSIVRFSGPPGDKLRKVKDEVLRLLPKSAKRAPMVRASGGSWRDR